MHCTINYRNTLRKCKSMSSIIIQQVIVHVYNKLQKLMFASENQVKAVVLSRTR